MEKKILNRSDTTYMGKLHRLEKFVTSPKVFTTDYKIKVETSFNGFIQKHNAFIEIDTIDKKTNNITNESSIILSETDLDSFIKALQKVSDQIKELQKRDLEAAKALSKIRDNENDIKHVKIDEIDNSPLQRCDIIHCYKFTPITNDLQKQDEYKPIYVNMHLSGVDEIDKKALVPIIGNVKVIYDSILQSRGSKYMKEMKEQAMKQLDERIKHEEMLRKNNNK